jgi:hypothetical protein
MVEISNPGGIKSVPVYIQSVTNFAASISLVSAPPSGRPVHMWRYFLTATRQVDGLASQFATALTAGTNYSKVTIQTRSGHVVTLTDARVVCITAAGSRNSFYPGSPIVAAGMEALMWECTGPIRVDGTVQYASYNWNGLNA